VDEAASEVVAPVLPPVLLPVSVVVDVVSAAAVVTSGLDATSPTAASPPKPIVPTAPAIAAPFVSRDRRRVDRSR
jgi:hypothetical protein